MSTMARQSYETGWLPVDFVAGLTVAALVVPEGMADAHLIWLSPGPETLRLQDGLEPTDSVAIG